MKYIGTTKSNGGHGKSDYIVSFSSLELKTLKCLLRKLPISTLEKNDGKELLKNAHKSINKVINSI